MTILTSFFSIWAFELTFGADKAPADVYMFMVLDTPAGSEVVGTYNTVVGEDDAACCHAEVCCVIGYGTANAPHQTAYGQT